MPYRRSYVLSRTSRPNHLEGPLAVYEPHTVKILMQPYCFRIYEPYLSFWATRCFFTAPLLRLLTAPFLGIWHSFSSSPLAFLKRDQGTYLGSQNNATHALIFTDVAVYFFIKTNFFKTVNKFQTAFS